MLILSFGCLRFLRESCLLYAFLLGYLPSIFLTFSAKPIDFYLQDCFTISILLLWRDENCYGKDGTTKIR